MAILIRQFHLYGIAMPMGYYLKLHIGLTIKIPTFNMCKHTYMCVHTNNKYMAKT